MADMQRNHKEAKIQNMGKEFDGRCLDTEDYQIALHIMAGLEDIKQGYFSDKSILEIAEEQGVQ
ncbi:MAG: hypothetical protein Q9M44_04670 [Ghiorsea sp.]|nr:hypothetical protein [Ghiorsea sp.]